MMIDRLNHRVRIKRARLYVHRDIGMQPEKLHLFDTREQAFEWAEAHKTYFCNVIDRYETYPKFTVCTEWVPPGSIPYLDTARLLGNTKKIKARI